MAKPAVLQYSAAGVYLPEGRQPIIPTNCEQSERNYFIGFIVIILFKRD
ncbi:MAG: hypothetical protein PVH61_34965 [Candidatus Aminicenantes bacterium]